MEGAVRKALQQAVADTDGRLLAVRLEIAGSVSGGQRLRDRMDAVAVEVGDVWLEKVLVKPSSDKGDSSGKAVLPMPLASEIRELIASLQVENGALSQWMGEFAELRGRLVGDLEVGDSVKFLSEQQAFRSLVEKVGGQL